MSKYRSALSVISNALNVLDKLSRLQQKQVSHSTAESATERYERRLRDRVERWRREVVAASTVFESDAMTTALVSDLIVLGNTGIREAYRLGRESSGVEDESLILSAITRNADFLAASFGPDARDAARRAVQGPDDDEAGAILDPFLSRIEMYGGAYWAAVWLGMGGRVFEDARNGVTHKVYRYLDPNAKHCHTCPPKAGEYDSWSEMLRICGGLPGDGSDDCRGNCRCWVEVI